MATGTIRSCPDASPGSCYSYLCAGPYALFSELNTGTACTLTLTNNDFYNLGATSNSGWAISYNAGTTCNLATSSGNSFYSTNNTTVWQTGTVNSGGNYSNWTDSTTVFNYP